jgi:hypothetical protein
VYWILKGVSPATAPAVANALVLMVGNVTTTFWDPATMVQVLTVTLMEFSVSVPNEADAVL